MDEAYHDHSRIASHRSSKHSAAVKFGSRVPIFPVKADKTPHTERGYLDATKDHWRINAWWNSYPEANPAMPTGPVSGVWVLDVDAGGWGFGTLEALEAEHGPLPETYAVKTGRGGMHLYFRYPENAEIRNSAGKLGPGLDVRGAGGYVLLPGSTTEGTYEVLERREIAEAPAWLIELVSKPKAPVQGSRPRGVAPATVAGGPIHEGVRNQTLFFMALDLKDSGRSREEALEKIISTNDARCTPPLEEAEVEAIVKSAYRYPVRGKRTPPEVLEALASLKRAWWATAWRGVGGKSDRDILRILIQWAERYGQLIPAGVRISISWRVLALAAGVGHRTIARVVKRLRLAGWLRGDNANRSGTDSGAFVLLPRQTGTIQSMELVREPPGVESGANLSRLPEITPCFRWRGFVGKGKAGVLYVLEVFGAQDLEELASRLGFKRPRDLRRLYLGPLAELGLVEDRGGVYALPGRGYAERVEGIRSAPYGGGPRKIRHKERPGGRWVVSVRDFPAMSEVERDEADRLEYEKHRAKHRKGLAGVPDEADPTPERTTAELERVPDVDPDLRDALREYLHRNPHRRGERPSWFSVALWSEEYVETKPPPAAVEVALAELLEGVAA